LDWGIDTSRVTFISLPKISYDEIVPRDWGPPGIFPLHKRMSLADVQFINSAPYSDRACNDSLELYTVSETGELYHSSNADTLISPLARQLGLDIVDVPFTSTGGNVLTDGIGSAFSTCILLTENRYNGVSDEEFFKLNESFLGFSNYHVISNFEEYGIQHIDCFLKVIDEETLLVSQAPEDHEHYEIYERIVADELSQLRNAYGKPYRIVRIKLGRIIEDYLTAYTNSLILNETVYVPLYGIASDSMALETWKSIMPGYKVKGFEFVIEDQPYLFFQSFEKYNEVGEVPGWAPDDALHCRTRAVWDEDMIFISLNRIAAEIPITQEAVLYASIKDYGKAGFEGDAIKLFWRVKGSARWELANMSSEKEREHWYVMMPREKEGTVIEYYVEATSRSGRVGRRPSTAPLGFYSFKYVEQREF
jgi:agmatine/peptidylarginine deiminase